MTQDLDRDRLKDLLERLGAETDADVLAAARAIDSMVRDSGHSWDELLAAAGEPATGEEGAATEEGVEAAAEEEGKAAEEEEGEAAEEEEAAPAATADGGGDAEVLRLIDSLLAMDSISEDLRDELTGYKEDIAEGIFEASDRRYVRALHARLKKRR